MSVITYQSIEVILSSAGAEVSAAEAHGIATGILCVDSRADDKLWLAEVFESDIPDNDSKDELVEFFNHIRSLLDNDDCSYDLLLPKDSALLSERIEALRDWCLGFLFGVGYTKSSLANTGSELDENHINNWPEETSEILKDLVELTKIESLDVDTEDSDENEAALVEINEYIRVAVLLVRNGLAKSEYSIH